MAEVFAFGPGPTSLTSALEAPDQPAPHRRDAQRSELAVGLGNAHTPPSFGAAGPFPQTAFQLRQKRRRAFRAGGNLRDAHSIHPGRPVVAPHGLPGGLQRLASATRRRADCGSTAAAPAWLSDGASVSVLRVWAAAAPPERSAPPPLVLAWDYSSHQLRAPLTPLDSGQGPLAPTRLDRAILAARGRSDATASPAGRLGLLPTGCTRRAAGRPCRASQVPARSFNARCRLTPRRVPPGRLVAASGPMLASPALAGWPRAALSNEAEPSSQNATARVFAAPGFDRRSCPPPAAELAA